MIFFLIGFLIHFYFMAFLLLHFHETILSQASQNKNYELFKYLVSLNKFDLNDVIISIIFFLMKLN